MEIKKLNKDLTDDYLHFFDNIAFCDNPDWMGCYCCFFYYSDDKLWDSRSGRENRDTCIKLIGAGRLNGFLAYDGGEPIGWCNADAKSNYPRITDNPEIPRDRLEKTGAIVCFTVDYRQRGKGVASALLKAACDDFSGKGYEQIEAYPHKHPQSEAQNYYGPLSLYEKNGFAPVREWGDHYIVRKVLNH